MSEINTVYPGSVNTESLDRLSGLDGELSAKVLCMKFDRWLSQVFRRRRCSAADSQPSPVSGLQVPFYRDSFCCSSSYPSGPQPARIRPPPQSLNIRESTIIAIEKSPRLKNAMARIREAESSIAIVDSKNRPSVDFSGSATLPRAGAGDGSHSAGSSHGQYPASRSPRMMCTPCR